VVYEVVRLIEGKPLFWAEHYHRLIDSCRIAQLDFSIPSVNPKKEVERLVTSNGVRSINFKMEVFFSALQLHYRLFLVPSHYPDNRLYTSGVPLGFLHEERVDPHAKVVNATIRGKANQKIEHGHYHEVLLVNSKDEITEGSRSNVFFISGSSLITPPLDEVLPGVTRYQVLKIAQQIGISVEEVVVKTSDIARFESAFITGTSPMLLPISRLDNHSFNPQHPVFNLLLEGYKQKVAEDLNAFEY